MQAGREEHDERGTRQQPAGHDVIIPVGGRGPFGNAKKGHHRQKDQQVVIQSMVRLEARDERCNPKQEPEVVVAMAVRPAAKSQ